MLKKMSLFSVFLTAFFFFHYHLCGLSQLILNTENSILFLRLFYTSNILFVIHQSYDDGTCSQIMRDATETQTRKLTYYTNGSCFINKDKKM